MEFNREGHIFRYPRIIKVIDKAVNFLISRPAHSLPLPKRFDGAGVYALYYTGDFEHYANIKAHQGRESIPIYVGKAVPSGWRRGRSSKVKECSLYQRLKEHTRSIKLVDNLKVEDFKCRFMILENQECSLISDIESALISRFKPLWNSVIDGFGNHDPGSGRYNQSPSEWDVLHPGRPWVKKLTGAAPKLDAILEKIGRTTSS